MLKYFYPLIWGKRQKLVKIMGHIIIIYRILCDQYNSQDTFKFKLILLVHSSAEGHYFKKTIFLRQKAITLACTHIKPAQWSHKALNKLSTWKILLSGVNRLCDSKVKLLLKNYSAFLILYDLFSHF